MSAVFSRRLMLERAVSVADGAGGFARVWTEIGAFWAEVRLRSGDLRDTEFGETPRLKLRVTTHAVPEGHAMRPLVGDRLRDGARVYQVSAVHEDDARGRFLVMLVSEEVGV
ncbi:MAG: head-tail adaptor protein [Pseudomonadota bacterium]